MVLTAPGKALEWRDLPDRSPGPEEIRVCVAACGVCRTDLHIVDGELPPGKLPLVPGHEIVGRIDALGANVQSDFKIGDLVGIPWLGHTCGTCSYCVEGHENLCDYPQFTGYTRDGGYATSVIADARFTFPLPDNYSVESLAPLLCAGLIGWRSLVRAGSAGRYLRIRRSSPHRDASGPAARADGVCPDPPWGHSDSRVCPRDGGCVGGRHERSPTEAPRRSHSLCARR